MKSLIADLLFPENRNCILCDRYIPKENPYSLCRFCIEKLRRMKRMCSRCGRPLEEEEICVSCETEEYAFGRVLCVYPYTKAMHSLLYRFKYGHQNYLAKHFAQMLSDFYDSHSLEYDYFQFVPISERRKRERGYNQMERIAHYMQESLGIPAISCITKIKHTPYLSGLARDEKRSVLKDAFRMEECFLMPNAKILLLDDIYTSGATGNELAGLIKAHRPDIAVDLLTLCNARKHQST